MITADDFIKANLIVGTPNSTKIAQFNEAIAYLQQSPIGADLIKLALNTGVHIKLFSGDNVYHAAAASDDSYPAKTIEWNPETGTIFTNEQPGTVQAPETIKVTGVISPALMLAHEMGHAVDPNFITNNDQNNIQYGKERA